jgi:hypothetical protein
MRGRGVAWPVYLGFVLAVLALPFTWVLWKIRRNPGTPPRRP